ncbi:hypothetical protein LXA43DRAFT_1145230 [Ganoderma leucocontextum]|nr:hypothetical protein LXA43DRAFT_1145230 [Ganoderma leucocontextum]
MSFPCNGCLKSFSMHRSLLQHLQKMTNPACIQVHEDLVSTIRRPIRHDHPHRHHRSSSASSSTRNSGSQPNPSSSTDPQASEQPKAVSAAATDASQGDEDLEDIPAHFEGDYFGAPEEYGEADFPFGDDEPPAQDLDEVQASVPTKESHIRQVTVVDDDKEDNVMDEAVGLNALEPDADDIPPPTSPATSRRSRSSEAMDEDPPLTSPPEDTSSQHEAQQPNGDDDGIGLAAHEHLRQAPTHVRHFGGRAGEPTISPDILVADNPYAPFNSRLDWEIARWGKLRGSSSTSLTELLQIQGVAEALGISFKNAKQLDEIVNEKILLRCPVFVRHQVAAQGEKSDFYARDLSPERLCHKTNKGGGSLMETHRGWQQK